MNSRSFSRFKHLHTLKKSDTILKYIEDRVDDDQLMELLNLKLNPDYTYVRKLDLTCKGDIELDLSVLLQVIVDKNVDTQKYINLLHQQYTDIIHLLFTDSLPITHKEVINIRLTKTSTLRNLNELPALYGAPEFPCYVQFVPSDVTYYNVSMTPYMTKVTTKDGLHTVFPIGLLKQLRKIDFVGKVIGYLLNGKFIISNVYPRTVNILSKRFIQIEVAIRNSKVPDVVLSRLWYVESLQDVKKITPDTGIVLFKRDALPKYGRSSNILEYSVENIQNLKFGD